MHSSKSVLISIGAASLATLAAFQNAVEAQSPTKTVVIYTGSVDSRSAERLLDLIGDSTDQIIGLKLVVEPSKESDRRYFTHRDGDQLNITTGDPLNAPRELIINGQMGTTWGMWKVDGFYLVKSGGMHAAGAMSWGAIPVDEATVRLSDHIRIVERDL